MWKLKIGRKLEVGRLALAIVGLMLVAAFCGCLGGKKEPTGTGGGAGGETDGNQTTNPDYSAQYADFVGDMQNYEYSKEYVFPVDNGAKQATIYVKIGTQGGGLPFPPGCYITVTVKDPAGSDKGSATLDPVTTTEATITLTSFTSYGNYTVWISGYGAAGMGYGGYYELKIEVDYP